MNERGEDSRLLAAEEENLQTLPQKGSIRIAYLTG